MPQTQPLFQVFPVDDAEDQDHLIGVVDLIHESSFTPPIVETVVPNARAAKLYADRNEIYRTLYPTLQHTLRQLDTAADARAKN